MNRGKLKMALLKVEIFSKSLKRTVPLQVILPVDKVLFAGGDSSKEKPFKTLYLLHGIFGSESDWLVNTRINALAMDHNLAVIMPAGENSFYIDGPTMAYGRFIGEELVELTRKMFPLSPLKEDTFIGGLSMGGYGALHNGLAFCDNFSHIVALSPALILERLQSDDFQGVATEKEVFKDIGELAISPLNPRYQIESGLAQGNPLPKLYLACGSEDNLLKPCEEFGEFLKKVAYDYEMVIAPGRHDWKFWDAQISQVMDWLPLEQETAGISSGNVGQDEQKTGR